MILVRSPLRITLGGGGTDLPCYAQKYGGFCLTAAITQYVYVSLMRPFSPGIYLKYSQLEHVERIDDVQHPIIRECLRVMGIAPQIEITTLADIPAGTGLGSSSSFTTALLKACAIYRRTMLHREALAELACTIEMERLNEPIGRQDQYAAALGGVSCLGFDERPQVQAMPIAASADTLAQLEDGLLLFYTGIKRKASTVLMDQLHRADESQMVENLTRVKQLGLKARDCICAGDLRAFGDLMQLQWEEKQQRSPGMSTPAIDNWYRLGKMHGARGGKLVGAGGGGFLLFYTEQPKKLRDGLRESGLEEVRFKFDYDGTKAIVS